jgi:hypothetical protein
MNYLLMYDEKDLAENVMKNGFENGSYSWQEAVLVAKYLRWIGGYGDTKLKTEITKFCQDHDPFFYPVPRRNTIKSLIKKSNDILIDYTDPIDIRESELQKIKIIKNFKLQQIALGILAITKRNFKYSNGYINRYFWRDIRNVVNFRRTTNLEIEKCFTLMDELEMVFPSWNVNSHKLLILDNNTPVIFHLSADKELKGLGAKYKEMVGGEILYCSNCEKPILKRSNRQFLCEECWREHRLAWDLDRKRH